MATADRPTRKDAARNREAILDAAVRVLGADPDAGVDEIAAAAGVNRATLYRHFGAREEILDVLREEAAAQGRVFVADAVAQLFGNGRDRPVLEVIDEIVWAGLQDTTRYRALMASDPRRADELLGPFTEVGEAVVRRGQERGELVGDLPAGLLYRQLLAVVLTGVRAVDEGAATPEDAASTIRRLLSGLRAADRTSG